MSIVLAKVQWTGAAGAVVAAAAAPDINSQVYSLVVPQRLRGGSFCEASIALAKRMG